MWFLLGFIASLLFVTAQAFASHYAHKQYVDPDFSVPDLSNESAALEERLMAWAARRHAEFENNLDSLFEPPREPNETEQRELDVVASRVSSRLWLRLAERYLEIGHLDDVLAAAHRAYRLSHRSRQQARALAVMAEAVLAQDDASLAVKLYGKSLDLDQDRGVRRRFESLVERFRLYVRDVAVDGERDSPSACVVFSDELKKPLPLRPEDYVKIVPRVDVLVSARKEQICLRGLRHGTSYELTLRSGLPGQSGARLIEPVRRKISVPDREPRVSFSTGAYVLPKSVDDTVPLKTVNVDAVALTLYRVHDRNLASSVLAGIVDIDRDLYAWTEAEIKGTAGSLLWQGTGAVESADNEETVTLIPVADMLEERLPGIYALVADPEARRRASSATQWLVVSDLGLTLFEGADGIHVVARSLETAEPAPDVALSLIARNNTILGQARTDQAGVARFAPGLIRGVGGDSPALLTASGAGEDYNFLRLTGPYLDLSERGIAGRPAPGVFDAFLYTDRGVYRPGESVRLGALLRDSTAHALATMPLTIAVVRPDGKEMYRTTLTGDDLGGYGFDIPLSPAARPGMWRASAYVDPKADPAGMVRFQVEDFVPQRIAVALRLEQSWLMPEQDASVLLSSDFLYGAPAADLETQAWLSIVESEKPFVGYEDFRFGLAQEEFHAVRESVDTARTSADGNVTIPFSLDNLPDTSRPVDALFEATVFDVGGRPVTRNLRRPLRLREVEVGLRRRGSSDFDLDKDAVFDLVALDRNAQPVPGRTITYEWLRETYDYDWYYSNARWNARYTVYDESLASGSIALGEDGTAQLQRRLGYGRYRLEIFDEDSGSAASYRFHVGWWSAAKTPLIPDQLELSVERNDVVEGEQIKAFVRAPFAGTAFVAVMNDRLLHHESIALPAEGAEIAIAAQADWGPGAYLLVTAFRPKAGDPSLLPTRAMGLAWFSIGRERRDLAVTFDAPDHVAPRRQVTLPLRVSSAAPLDNERLRLTIAAVDEGILSMTGFATPQPGEHYFGQRRLGVEMRDLYGRLIRPLNGRKAVLRSGGDEAKAAPNEENVAGITTRTVKTVALYRRDIEVDANGRGSVTLDLPDFSGRLRLMAVAYGSTQLGAGDADLTVRDPVAVDLLLPRFLAPGDEALATVSLHNLSGAGQTFEFGLESSGGVALESALTFKVTLDEGERFATPMPIRAEHVGDGRIALRVSADGMTTVERSWDIAVRPAQQYVSRRVVTYVAPGESIALDPGAFEEFLPGTGLAHLTVTARPEYNVPALLDDLNRYPYGCTEQTISRALPLLYFAEVARRWDEDADEAALRRAIEYGIRRVLDRQRSDGAFSLWHSYGDAHDWLSAYAFDFLTRARETGYDVPDAVYTHARHWLKDYLLESDRGSSTAQAYALYLLARIGEIGASDVRYHAPRIGKRVQTRLGLGHVAAALAAVGETEKSEDWFERAIRNQRSDDYYYYDFGSRLRDGAALAALVAEAFPRSERQQALAEAIEKEFDRRQYFSTQEMAWLLVATHALSESTAAEFTVRLDSEALGPRFEPVRLKREAGAEKAMPTVMENIGPGPVRLIRAVRGVPVAPLRATEDGFHLSRRFFTLDGKRADLAVVKQNALFVVVIKGKALKRGEQHALIVDLLPAGFEIENTAIGGIAVDEKATFLPELSNLAFQAARDDRYVAAIDLTRYAPNFAVAYVVRAVTPGRYTLPGSFVEDMYKPRYHARGKQSTLTIAAR